MDLRIAQQQFEVTVTNLLVTQSDDGGMDNSRCHHTCGHVWNY